MSTCCTSADICPQTCKRPYIITNITTAIGHCGLKVTKCLRVQDLCSPVRMSLKFFFVQATTLQWYIHTYYCAANNVQVVFAIFASYPSLVKFDTAMGALVWNSNHLEHEPPLDCCVQQWISFTLALLEPRFRYCKVSYLFNLQYCISGQQVNNSVQNTSEQVVYLDYVVFDTLISPAGWIATQFTLL